jgi:predicted RNase H-like nuclease (RuvC/YqgF family)
MTEPISALPTSTETTDVLRFLRRFADLMSNGSNSDNLLRAAGLLETHSDLLRQTIELLKAERARSDANAETRKASEARIGELDREICSLQSRLAEQQAHADAFVVELERRRDEIVTEMERRQGEFLKRAEDAEADLAAMRGAPPAIPEGFVAVPLATLRVAKAQFESLADLFEKSGNIVSQVMCEASASTLDRVVGGADGADGAADQAQDAA